MKRTTENSKTLPVTEGQAGMSISPVRMKNLSKPEAIQLVVSLIEKYQISGSELASQLTQQIIPRPSVTKAKAKYKGPGGELWSGRGAKPAWVKEILGCGEDLSLYLVAKNS